MRAETDAANTEQAKAAKVEENFERLLAWAREEERRRCEADNNYSRARERTAAATARITVVEEEVRFITCFERGIRLRRVGYAVCMYGPNLFSVAEVLQQPNILSKSSQRKVM